MFVVRLAIETSVFLGCESIQIPPNSLDRLRYFAGGTLLRALEKQVLDKMRNTVDPLCFVPSADGDPDSQADACHVGHFGRGDSEAVFQLIDLIHYKFLAV